MRKSTNPSTTNAWHPALFGQGGFLDVALLNRGAAVVGLPCFFSDGKTACARKVPLAFFETFCSPPRWKMYQDRLVEDFVESNATVSVSSKCVVQVCVIRVLVHTDSVLQW